MALFRSLCTRIVRQTRNNKVQSIKLQNVARVSAVQPVRLCSHIASSDVDDVEFFEMVQLYFQRAIDLCENDLVKEVKGRTSDQEKKNRVRGILDMVKPCNHVIAMTFPIKRDDGSWEIISGWRFRRLPFQNCTCENNWSLLFGQFEYSY